MTAAQKSLFWCSLVLCVLCHVALCAIDYETVKSNNLIFNGDFVDGANGWGGIGSNSRVTAEEYYETPNSLALGPENANVTQVIELSQVDPCTLLLYGAVMAEDDALRSEDGAGEYGIGLGIVYTNGTKDYIYFPWLLQDSWSWELQNAEIELGQPIDTITLSVSMLHSRGRVYFDDLALAEDKPTTANTQSVAATTENTAPDVATNAWEESNDMQTTFAIQSEILETSEAEWVPDEAVMETTVDDTIEATSGAESELTQETTVITTEAQDTTELESESISTDAATTEAAPTADIDTTTSTTATANIDDTTATDNIDDTSATVNIDDTATTANIEDTATTGNIEDTTATGNIEDTTATANIEDTTATDNIESTATAANIENPTTTDITEIAVTRAEHSMATTANTAIVAVETTYLTPADCTCKEWGEFGPCSSSCGGGVSVRHRNCTEGSNGGALCAELGLKAPTMTESQECNTHQCVAVQLLHKNSFTESTGSHWVSVGKGFQMSEQTPARATGTYSIQVNPSAGGVAGAFQAVDLKQDQPGRITVSAYAMADKPISLTETLPHSFAILLELTDIFGMGTNISLPFVLPTPGQWDYLDYSYDPPVAIDSMRLFCLTHNLTSNAYCGDIFLQQGPVVAIDPACECSAWSTWGQCSTDCGVGIRNRTRACKTHSSACDELGIVTRQTETCQMPGSCPSNCTCGEWSTFGACSVLCGSGVQSRSRVCAEAAHGGATCNALGMVATDTKPCIGLEEDCKASIVGTENLLLSGNFEDSPGNWVPVGKGFKLVNTTYIDGQTAAMLLPSNTDERAVSGMTQAVSLPTVNEWVFGLSGNWYFSQEALTSLKENQTLARVELRIDAVGGRRRALVQQIATVVPATVKPNEWTWLGLRYQVPTTANGLTVSILSRNVAEPVLVDQVRLVAAQAANLSNDCTCTKWVQDTTGCDTNLSSQLVMVNWTRSCIEAAEGGKSCAALNMTDREQRPCVSEVPSQVTDTQPQTATASTEESSSSSSTGVIVGIVLGSVAGLLLVAGGVWVWRRKRNGRNDIGHGDREFSRNLSTSRKKGQYVAATSDSGNLRDKVNAWRETMYKERLMVQPHLNTVE